METMERIFQKFLTDNLEDIQKAERIIWHLTGIKEEYGKKVLKVDFYLLQEFFEKHLNAIAEKCSKITTILAERIKQAISMEYEGTLYSLYDYEKRKYLLKNPVELFTYILIKILLIKSEKDPLQVKQVLESFFGEDYPIFTKIALFVIGQNINTFKDLFWKALEGKGEKIFEGAPIFWGDELKRVLENLSPLNDNQRELLKEKIEVATNKYGETLEDKDKKGYEKKRRT